MVQLGIPAIAFCNVQQEARGGFVKLPIGPITQFFGAGQRAKPSHELQTDPINIRSLAPSAMFSTMLSEALQK